MKNDKLGQLYEVIAGIGSAEDCRLFFEDLCTNKELEQMAERLNAARLLMAGKTYDEIIAVAEISSATLSRVSKCVKYGEGYHRVLNRDANEKK